MYTEFEHKNTKHLGVLKTFKNLIMGTEKTLRPSPCSKEELEMYMGLLKEKHQTANLELYALEHPQKETNGTAETHREVGDIADHIVNEPNKFILKKRIESTDKFLKANRAAQKRILNGTFGICFYTGDPIPKERLLLEPHTRWKSAEIKEIAEREKIKKF